MDFLRYVSSMNTSNSSIARKGDSADPHSEVDRATVVKDFSPPLNVLMLVTVLFRLLLFWVLLSVTLKFTSSFSSSNVMTPGSPCADVRVRARIRVRVCVRVCRVCRVCMCVYVKMCVHECVPVRAVATRYVQARIVARRRQLYAYTELKVATCVCVGACMCACTCARACARVRAHARALCHQRDEKCAGSSVQGTELLRPGLRNRHAQQQQRHSKAHACTDTATTPECPFFVSVLLNFKPQDARQWLLILLSLQTDCRYATGLWWTSEVGRVRHASPINQGWPHGKKRMGGFRNTIRNEPSRGRSLAHGLAMDKTQDHRSTIDQWLAVGGGWWLMAVTVGGWWRVAVVGGWRLAVGIPRGCPQGCP